MPLTLPPPPPPSWQVRLHRDLRELFQEPLEGIHVVVDDKNMREMCLILTPLSGPFLGLKLHLTVSIPENYPAVPPEVSIETPVPHPNVISTSWICCDILNPQTEYSGGGGYTPGYLLKYVFLQLLSFFTSETIEQDYGGTRNLTDYTRGRTSRWIKAYGCKKCGFDGMGSLQPDEQQGQSEKPRVVSETRSNEQDIDGVLRQMYETLNVDCRMEIINKLNDRDILSTLKPYDGSMETENVLLERRLNCFFLRKGFREKDVVLGIGVALDASTRKRKPVVMSLDLLSHEAFKVYGHRSSLLGVRFQHFLPVALDDEHFYRAKGPMQTCLMDIVGSYNPWDPAVVLQILPALMNQMVLRLVQSCDKHGDTLRSSGFNNQLMKASEFALEGYCLLYHLFSKLVRDNKKLAEVVRRKVQEFIGDVKYRGKDVVPDIGEFLTYLLVMEDIEWLPKDPQKPQVAGLFLEECLARKVLWFLKDHPHLAHMEPDNYPSELRINQTYGSCKTSMRLVLFQVHFFNMTRSMETEFDQRYGFPPEKMLSQLMQNMREIYQAADWCTYLKVFGVETGGGWKWQLVKLLKRATESSHKRGYHNVPYTKSELYKLRKAAEPQCPPPEGWVDNGLRPPSPHRSFFPARPGQTSYNRAPSFRGRAGGSSSRGRGQFRGFY